MKNIPIIVIGGVIVVSVCSFFLLKHNKTNTTNSRYTNTQVSPAVTQEVAVTTTTEKESVPLPQETDIIRTFFQLIDEGKPSDAVNMMTPANTSSDSTKQAWGVQFNAFESIQIINLEPSMQSDWTDTEHRYKVIAQVHVKPDAANAAPIPNYGWDNGENIRWISLQQINGKWMIGEIATGP